MEFTLCSNSLLITDPYDEKGWYQCLISNAQPGVWRLDPRKQLLIQKDYNEDNLKWEHSVLCCSISRGVIGYFDFYSYCKDSNKSQWGIIVPQQTEFNEYEVGFNSLGQICGLRVNVNIVCEDCNAGVRSDEFYYQGESYDLCKACYPRHSQLSVQRFQLKCKQIYD